MNILTAYVCQTKTLAFAAPWTDDMMHIFSGPQAVLA